MRRPESVTSPTRASGAPSTVNHRGRRLAVLRPPVSSTTIRYLPGPAAAGTENEAA